MSIVIKEIHVKTTIEKNTKQGFVSHETIQRIKYDLLKEIQKNKIGAQSPKKER